MVIGPLVNFQEEIGLVSCNSHSCQSLHFHFKITSLCWFSQFPFPAFSALAYKKFDKCASGVLCFVVHGFDTIDSSSRTYVRPKYNSIHQIKNYHPFNLVLMYFYIFEFPVTLSASYLGRFE